MNSDTFINVIVHDLTAATRKPVPKSELRRRLEALRKQVEAETAKAFGDCKRCYGKGYSTVPVFCEEAADFGGDAIQHHRLPLVRFCSCERGEQLERLMHQHLASRGGKARAGTLSKAQRSDSARKAVNARWAKYRAERDENKT